MLALLVTETGLPLIEVLPHIRRRTVRVIIVALIIVVTKSATSLWHCVSVNICTNIYSCVYTYVRTYIHMYIHNNGKWEIYKIAIKIAIILLKDFRPNTD